MKKFIDWIKAQVTPTPEEKARFEQQIEQLIAEEEAAQAAREKADARMWAGLRWCAPSKGDSQQ